METTLRTAIGQQFEAAITMFDHALQACPDELWSVRLYGDHQPQPELSEFWYIAYHTLFWLDLYLTGSIEGFIPPAPFTLSELDPTGVLPERQYSRDELSTYIEYVRTKCRSTIKTLSDEKARQRCTFSWGEVTFAGLILDNMRHVQEHTAQLNMILGQKIGWAPGWVTLAKNPAT